jgi:hypothetical protein
LTSHAFPSILPNAARPLILEKNRRPSWKSDRKEKMAKYLQCSECGKLAFYYDDYVGTEKPFYRRFMRYPEGETKLEPPRCFSCGAVPRLIHENIKEEKAAAKH